MNRRSCIQTSRVLLITVATVLSMAVAFGEGARQPNVLFLLADQWRAQAFGYAGDPNAKTPNIDKLKQESVSFVNAVAGMPVCCPTRASLLTGQRPLTHGVFMNDVPLADRAITIAEALTGYDTGYIGKWHLDAHGRSAYIPRERRQGFEYWKALECTHEYNKSYYYSDGPEKLLWEGYDAIAQTRDAQGYLRRCAESGKPFFLFVAWGPPHSPYKTAPARFRALFDPAKIVLRPNVPESLREKARDALAGYYAHCAALDECVGELLGTLEDTGLRKSTLVVFTSDHGDLLGSHDAFNKQQPFDEAIRVPLILRWPEGLGSKSRELDALINSEDIMPTILGLCRVAIPKTSEGLDFSRYLKGGKNPSDGFTLISCAAPFGQWDRRRGGREYRALRTLRYTYVRDLNGPWMLYDNASDPYQLTNLVNQSGSAKVQARLDSALTQRLGEIGDKFLPGQFYIEKWGYTVDTNGTVPYTH